MFILSRHLNIDFFYFNHSLVFTSVSCVPLYSRFIYTSVNIIKYLCKRSICICVHCCVTWTVTYLLLPNCVVALLIISLTYVIKTSTLL